MSGRWLAVALVAGLLILNIWISSQALQPASRVQIPYSPTFLQQISSGNVSQTTSTSNDTIQGTFKNAGQVPAQRSQRPGDDGLLHPDPVLRQAEPRCSTCSNRRT